MSCVRGFCLEFPDVPTLNIAQVMMLRRPHTGQGPTADDSYSATDENIMN